MIAYLVTPLPLAPSHRKELNNARDEVKEIVKRADEKAIDCCLKEKYL